VQQNINDDIISYLNYFCNFYANHFAMSSSPMERTSSYFYETHLDIDPLQTWNLDGKVISNLEFGLLNGEPHWEGVVDTHTLIIKSVGT
jgi:hypothetical protein